MKSIALPLLATLLLSLAGTAAAAPPAPPAAPPTSPAAIPIPPASAAPEEPPYQSTALLLSLGGSAAAWSTFFLGANIDHGSNPAVPLGLIATLFAPSFGHWYAGDSFSRGFEIRLIGAGAMLAGAIPALSCVDECNSGGPLEVVFYAGLGLYLYGTLDDIITAPGAARAAQPHRVGIAPMMQRGSRGLVVTAQF